MPPGRGVPGRHQRCMTSVTDCAQVHAHSRKSLSLSMYPGDRLHMDTPGVRQCQSRRVGRDIAHTTVHSLRLRAIILWVMAVRSATSSVRERRPARYSLSTWANSTRNARPRSRSHASCARCSSATHVPYKSPSSDFAGTGAASPSATNRRTISLTVHPCSSARACSAICCARVTVTRRGAVLRSRGLGSERLGKGCSHCNSPIFGAVMLLPTSLRCRLACDHRTTRERSPRSAT
jgi:hypothetical protein